MAEDSEVVKCDSCGKTVSNAYASRNEEKYCLECAGLISRDSQLKQMEGEERKRKP